LNRLVGVPSHCWEGAVLDVSGGCFVAELEDLRSGARSVAVFDVGDVDPGDVGLCVPGALFFWAVGAGCSSVTFRRE